MAQYWVDNCCFDFSGIFPNQKYDFPFFVSDAVFDSSNQLYFDPEGLYQKKIPAVILSENN